MFQKCNAVKMSKGLEWDFLLGSPEKRILRTYLKKRILVQNDAKLMPNVVQGGREVPCIAGLPAIQSSTVGRNP